MTATLTSIEGADAPDVDVRPSPRPSHGRRFPLLVLAAVVVGLAFRVAIGLTDDAATTDETAYLRSGAALVAGDGFERDGRPELHFPPLIPFILGVTSHVFADPHTGTVAMTVTAGTALIVPLALLGRRIGGQTAGVTTAWVAALAPGLATMPQIRGTGSEAVYVLLVVGALWLVVSASDHPVRGRRLHLGAAGVLAGLAYLTRPEGLFVAVPLGLAAAWPAVRGRPPGARLRPALSVAAWFLVPVVVCAFGYAAYLHDHTGRWQLTAKSQDASIDAWQAVARADRQARNDILYELDETGLGFAAEYSSLTSLARDDPSGYLAIVRTNVGKAVDTVWVPSVLPVPVWALAALGAWRHRRSHVVRLVLVIGALPVATALAFFVQHRYLLLTVALASVLAGTALASLPRRVHRVGGGALLGLLVAASVLTFRGDVAGWWHPVEQTDQRRAGEWIAANTDPDDRIMARSMIIDFYADRTTVAIPAADLDEIMTFARHYGVRYLVVDWYTVERLIPQLEPLRDDDEPPGLRLVHEVTAEGRTARIFVLDPAPPPSTAQAPTLGFTGDGA